MADISETIVNVFRQKTVAIIGDLVADQYLNGTISRVSREAPVFILRHDETSTLPGAAANAAANVASLGGNTVVVGLVGDDANGRLLLSRLRRRDRLQQDRTRQTRHYDYEGSNTRRTATRIPAAGYQGRL